MATHTLRLATIIDLPRLLEITLNALPQDPFYCYLWAHRDEYLYDHQGYWLQQLQADIYNPAYTFLVVEVTGERGGKIPVAFGIWERRGEDREANERRDMRKEPWGAEAWNFHRLSLQNLLSAYPRRDAPQARLAACNSVLAAMTQHFDKNMPSRFNLELICTHRAYQCRGAGTMIVRWGLTEATRDRVPVSVAASPLGEKLYLKCGFEVYGSWVVRAEGDNGKEVVFRTMVWRGLEG
ncbi:MAG: hypothetical protein M1839_004747 [Geoglossum umbratile]|nr:MAG: hypothetical protein M1839_004747 [Geoglossum umbratile]